MNDIPVAVHRRRRPNPLAWTPTPRHRSARRYLVLVCLLVMAGSPVAGWAYVGPGAGLSIIGSLLALFAAILLAVIGFLWYPARRLLRFLRARRSDTRSPIDKPGTDA